jgi:hypothetical protein
VTGGSPAAPGRLFLHVGSPKTGTTFLQNVLWSHRQLAEEQGLLLPLDSFADHYLASLDVRGLSARAEHPERAVGIWDRVARQARAWAGTTLVSHELFAAATAAQASRALATLGADLEVHVVLTARDLVRQIPAEWQEHVKHRYPRTLAEFVDDLQADEAGKSWFWRVQDVAGIAGRWGGTLPPSRVHVVTVPPAGADPEILWERFATLLGLTPESFDLSASRANTSLGIEQAELLRRVNAQLGDKLPLPGPYPVVVKNVLAHRVLAARQGTPLALDLAAVEFAVRRSDEMATRLAAMDVDVVGDLDDLRPDPGVAAAGANPAAFVTPPDSVLLDESVAAVIGLLEVLADRRAERRYEELVKQLRRRPVRFVVGRLRDRLRSRRRTLRPTMARRLRRRRRT